MHAIYGLGKLILHPAASRSTFSSSPLDRDLKSSGELRHMYFLVARKPPYRDQGSMWRTHAGGRPEICHRNVSVAYSLHRGHCAARACEGNSCSPLNMICRFPLDKGERRSLIIIGQGKRLL